MASRALQQSGTAAVVAATGSPLRRLGPARELSGCANPTRTVSSEERSVKRKTLVFVAAVLWLSCGCAFADPPAQAPAPTAIPLYDGPAPGTDPAAAAEIDESSGGGHVLRNVTAPTLTPFLPEPAKATGTAVIIAPGGAFMMLSIDQEGNDVARWLAARGVAAFVLKYRLEHTPSNQALFAMDLGAKILRLTHRSTPDLPK